MKHFSNTLPEIALHKLLEASIREHTQTTESIARIRQTRGGMYLIEGNNETLWFVKLKAPESYPMFMAEADGLLALSACEAFRIPRMVGFGKNEFFSYIILEYLELRPLKSREDNIKAGHALACLHQNLGRRYGWPTDNFIGETPQHNRWHNKWHDFFANERLRPQLQLAGEYALPKAFLSAGEKLMERLPELIGDHHPKASLLHGDLWQGNIAMDPSGNPALFDPAVYYGDSETDLAMSELFGGFSSDFYTAYHAVRPIDKAYGLRRKLYQLYHVLNHLNLFGPSYSSQAKGLIESLLAECPN